MRLISYLDGAEDRLAVVVDGRALLATELDGPRSMADLLLGGPPAVSALQEALAGASQRVTNQGPQIDSLTLLSPVPRPGKIVAIGLNYRDHAAEAGLPPPENPVVFAKFSSSVIAHRADIRWDPALTAEVDYEAELAVVIGRTARRVTEADALSYVLGYTCCNDVSARDLQFSESQWVRAKSLDSFCPLGPVLVTTDEIPDPQTLSVRCMVDGVERQSGSTSDMFFSVRQLISYCSAAFTLEPGDVIITGTPAGVGFFRNPKVLLRDGTEVVVEIDNIGRLVNVCREETGDRVGSIALAAPVGADLA